jgi:hypothetical protein
VCLGPVPQTGSGVDTLVLVGPPLATRSPNATFLFDAVVDSGVPGVLDVEVRVDGAALWTPVGLNATFVVTGLSEGAHTLEARAR